MVLGVDHLVADILAVQEAFSDDIPLELLDSVMGYIGPRKPQKLCRESRVRCQQCCDGSWWHRQVEAHKGHAFDPVRQLQYEIMEGSVVSKQGSCCQPVKVGDSTGHWGILACHKDRLYVGIDYDGADKSIKEVDVRSGRSRAAVKPEFKPTVFDVADRQEQGLRFSYLDPCQRNCVFIVDEGCEKERRISLPSVSGSVRFITPNVICASVSRHYELRLALVEIGDDDETPKYLDDFDLGVAGMYIRGMEISPCGHILQVKTREKTIEIGVHYA
ncbi:hypothetical protein Pmar_PMAR003724 [Perkinsus marinus ATCC 50983]|uniref:F-box domain-containing protein n=1 Tax=Perkinsus marinus (strain ATCC 50983 / TXsc) TaxID=423536 RepID=C5KI48_PERM5|nr:hypothetical protein Pmar_PMAR003724 [Perkinsus marinus ATCC 50983]EER16260.1 hypothetical protein Pmar_PMAR003724 [Perkinsus marinus ATCC 50983]|eukprot:XP_002784464.1 hypothetical protein Pmar_PMAR003724 [Perkinsus marinus ATCC 50983]